MSTAENRELTPREYLALERAAEIRHEFYRGGLRAMSGATRSHNLIVTNLVTAFGNRLRGRPCETYSNVMRVFVEPTGLYTYPDIVVTCGGPRFQDGVHDTLLNPSLIVEVLSDSTESHDRGFKTIQYRRLESLRTYVLISQKSMLVEWHTRVGADLWAIRVAIGADGVLDLGDALAVPVSIPLAEIYDRVEFAPVPSDGCRI
ncbi:Uma2 family endonuclease [Aquisphaera insulae]|uniref:Uma2 family endonuclease n=1 Tax=Aquisphaera insulae TaxID=2712864 RepID=UPI0013EC94BA|nr:Uma2 family endonuclease [Aquisphaera insulae]